MHQESYRRVVELLILPTLVALAWVGIRPCSWVAGTNRAYSSEVRDLPYSAACVDSPFLVESSCLLMAYILPEAASSTVADT